MSALLHIKNLSVAFTSRSPLSAGATKVVDKVSLEINTGECVALVGESGSGKSITALSVLQLLPGTASHPSGNILLNGDDLLALKGVALQAVRGKRISMIFQEPMTSLNPLHTLGKQLAEALMLHGMKDKKKIEARIKELLMQVGLKKLVDRMDAYPHQLSGGQRQRVMIAMALANEPELLIADEPTTALDVTVQAEILELLQRLQKERGMAMLFITHDLGLVKKIADTVAVMHRGKIVEQGKVKTVFSKPKHDYTEKLLDAAPSGAPVRAKKEAPVWVDAKKLSVHFPIKGGAFGTTRGVVKAVDNVSMRVKQGHTLGVVGESGSGKSTLGLSLLRLVPAQGTVLINKDDIFSLSGDDVRKLRRNVQFVFQDPYASLNPRLTVGDAIAEGLEAHGVVADKHERNKRVAEALKEVGLDPKMASRYPHAFSGGQRQRICIARALILKPQLMIFDEPTSALDVSTQAEILALLKRLQKDYDLTYIFISHDLRVIKAISHDIIVLREGKIVEQGARTQIFSKPKNAYTKALLDAALV